MMSEINRAYAVLGNSKKRQEYDQRYWTHLANWPTWGDQVTAQTPHEPDLMDASSKGWGGYFSFGQRVFKTWQQSFALRQQLTLRGASWAWPARC